MTDMSYLLTNFTRRVVGLTHAVAVSADGLLLGATDRLSRDGAERLAAVASGLSSLLTGAAQELHAGAVRVNLAELDAGFLITMAISTRAVLMVLAQPSADIGQVTAEMTAFAASVGAQITPSFAGSGARS